MDMVFFFRTTASLHERKEAAVHDMRKRQALPSDQCARERVQVAAWR
jgi:hypothetical protein